MVSIPFSRTLSFSASVSSLRSTYTYATSDFPLECDVYAPGAEGLLEDAMAAYEFAQMYGASVTEANRTVAVAGASAGFFMATLIARHAIPKPAALLSITGIPTARHPFFNSSILLTPASIRDEEVEEFVSGPARVGHTLVHSPMAFSAGQLLPSGRKNPENVRPSQLAEAAAKQDVLTRECLYDYYRHKNAFPGV
ncbi:hypothetical protein DL767_009124 [Monosporascus sp. MG133]|nr:hypothetical protein DL767_009124 [Monosporascus sp. MG133]